MASCGALIFGLSVDVGATQYGANIGIQDYSVKQRDAFGNYTVLQRAFNKRADFTVWVASTLVNRIANLLAKYRAIPVLYIGSDSYTSTAIYGFFKDFNLSIAYPDVTVHTITIEGLT